MPNRSLRLSSLVACFLLIVSCSGTERAGDFAAQNVALDVPEGATAYVPTLDGPLRVLSATPGGALLGMAPEQPVTVTFSQPMVPLGDAPDVPPGTLRLDPDVPGTLRWEGTQTLVFQPANPLPPATAFRATLAAGLVSVGGERLDSPFSWEFETPRPMLVSSNPSTGERYADPRLSIHLSFNQRVDARRAGAYVELLRTNERSQAVRVSVANRGDSTLVVDPAEPLAAGARYELRLLPGLPSAEGRLGMRDTAVVRFDTYGPLRLLEARQERTWRDEGKPGVDPGRGVTLVFSTPVRFGDLRQALSFSPAVELPAGIEAQDDVVSAEHVLPPVWEPETAYTVIVRDLKDQFGQTLAEGRAGFRTRAYEPAFTAATGLLVVEAEQQAFIPVRATNVERIRLGLQRLSADAVIPLLRVYDWNHYYGPEEMDDRGQPLKPRPEPVPLQRTVALGIGRNRPSYAPLRLDSLMQNRAGIVAYRITTDEVPGEAQREWRGIAQVTRLGLTAKFSAHQNLIFVTDLAQGRPVAGAAVTIRDIDNRVRWQGTTDETGKAVSPGWAALGIEPPGPWDRPVQFAFVEHNGDVAFTSSAYDDGLESYRFNIPFQWQPEPKTVTGSVFSDRGLYRSGETVFVKAILREKIDAEWRAVTDSVRVFVDSPRGQRVLDRRFQPSDLGTFDFEWTAPPSAEQGVYTIRVAFAADTAAARRESWEPGDVATGSFRVDAFRTATFAVTAHSAAEAYVAGDFFEGSIEGRYLFGATMAGQPVRYTLSREPGYYTPPGYDAYRFGAYQYDGTYTHYRQLVHADTVLGAEGIVRVRHQLQTSEIGTTATLVWSGSVTDPARQELGARREIILHPGLFYIGLKPRTTFIDLSEDRTMTVDVITVDPNGMPVSGQPVSVELIRQHWNSVREVGTDGRLRWRTERTEEVLGRSSVQTEPRQAKRLQMPVPEGGSYIIRATARDVRGNAIRSEAYFYATGSSYVAWERRDDDRIDLVADRRSYRPGETARIMVQSPYESATALITVEREGILSSRIETLRGSTPQIEIPLTERHLPNVYVSVILLTGRTAPPSAGADAGAPGFKVGYVALEVDPGAHRLHVDVEPDKTEYRPGDEVTVTFQLRDAEGKGVAGEIAFSAADAGVLNLIGYRLPDPFETFYGSRPLGVTTTESRANLVDQRNFGQKEEDLGGGGGDRDFLLRRDFRPSAHWAPALRTDRRGRATVTFRLPENLTTFRLMATALTASHDFGTGTADIVVTQPLVMQPALPRFTRVGDRFEAGVLVSNTTGADGEVTVTAQAEGLELTGPASQRIRLSDGQTREVRFAWHAARAGTAKLTFEARLGNERDAFETTLPIQVPQTKHTTATFASTDGTAREALRLPSERVPGAGSFTVHLSSTALVGLEGAATYLFEYPYGCLEQKTSRIRPLLAGREMTEAFGLDVLDGERDAVVEAWLRDLHDFWTGSGFAMWPGARYENPYVSAYVLLALADAKDAGFDIPADLTAHALERLAAQVRNRSERPSYYSPSTWADTRALMLYALARHGRVLDGEIDALAASAVQNAALLSADGESHLLRTLVHTRRPAFERYRAHFADRIRQRVRTEATTAYIAVPDDPAYDWIFASNVRATALGLTALIEAGADADLRPLAERMVRYLMTARQSGHWATTQDNAAVIDAFAAFYRAYEQVAPAFSAEVRVAGQRLLAEQFQGRSLRVAAAERAPDALPSGETLPVEITKSGQGTLYYALRLQTFSTAPQPAAANGLSLERRMQRLDPTGKPVGEVEPTGGRTVTLQAGELVRVTLRVTSPVDRTYVVVDDALPAGLEALNAAFATTDQAVLDHARADANGWGYSFNHTELRDDRVLLFADFLGRGEHTFTYVARATTPGTFVHPSVQAEMMYQPETNGRTAAGTLVVAAPEGRTAAP